MTDYIRLTGVFSAQKMIRQSRLSTVGETMEEKLIIVRTKPE